MTRAAGNLALAVFLCTTALSYAKPSDGSGHGTGSDASGQKLPDSGPLVQVTAESANKTATVALTLNLWHLDEGDFFGAKNARAHFFNASVETPVAQGASYANVANFDGLATATSIKFKYIYESISLGNVGARTKADYLEECRALQAIAHLPPQGYSCIVDDIEGKLDELKSDDAAARKKLRDGEHPLTPKETEELKTLLDKNHALEEKLKQGVKHLKAVEKPTLDAIWLLGVSGRVGYDTHKYFDPASLGKSSVTKVPYEFSLEATRVFANGNASANFSFTYENAFEDGPAQTKCLTTAAPITSCVNGSIGAPSATERAMIGFDLRAIIKPFGIPIGLNPGIKYDAKANSEAFQFPIYLFTSKTGGLSGGVRYDWNSEKHVSVVGVFASTTFNIVDAD